LPIPLRSLDPVLDQRTRFCAGFPIFRKMQNCNTCLLRFKQNFSIRRIDLGKDSNFPGSGHPYCSGPRNLFFRICLFCPPAGTSPPRFSERRKVRTASIRTLALPSVRRVMHVGLNAPKHKDGRRDRNLATAIACFPKLPLPASEEAGKILRSVDNGPCRWRCLRSWSS